MQINIKTLTARPWQLKLTSRNFLSLTSRELKVTERKKSMLSLNSCKHKKKPHKFLSTYIALLNICRQRLFLIANDDCKCFERSSLISLCSTRHIFLIAMLNKTVSFFMDSRALDYIFRLCNSLTHFQSRENCSKPEIFPDTLQMAFVGKNTISTSQIVDPFWVGRAILDYFSRFV